MRKKFEIKKIKLNIHNKEKMKNFYSNILKLVLLEETNNKLVYSTSNSCSPMIELHIQPLEKKAEQNMGLYHFALLLPQRSDLGSILLHFVEVKYPLVGASDHLVSEALYLKDPEGNDIEIYCDRDQSTWEWENDLVKMDTIPIDAEGLFAIAGEFKGFPPETTLGHLHFYGGDLIAGNTFFGNILGLEVVANLGKTAHFYAVNKYHHQIGFNIWKGTNLPKHEADMLGLFAWEVEVDESTYTSVLAKLAEIEYPHEVRNAIIYLGDAVGTTLELKI
ncbi:MAG: VOC family protein [Culicoidibacterales bacterium]